MQSPGYTKLFDVATQLKRSQPCVLGYIKSGKLAAEKGADGHWYISDTSLAKFIYQRDLATFFELYCALSQPNFNDDPPDQHASPHATVPATA